MSIFLALSPIVQGLSFDPPSRFAQHCFTQRFGHHCPECSSLLSPPGQNLLSPYLFPRYTRLLHNTVNSAPICLPVLCPRRVISLRIFFPSWTRLISNLELARSFFDRSLFLLFRRFMAAGYSTHPPPHPPPRQIHIQSDLLHGHFPINSFTFPPRCTLPRFSHSFP